MNAPAGIEPERIRRRNEAPAKSGDYVLYWMQQSQRAEFNPALEFAIDQANELGLPVVVGFGLTTNVPEAPAHAYPFMIEGLREVERQLAERKIPLIVRTGSPPNVALELATRAALLVCDRGYLRWQREWRWALEGRADCPVLEVEGDVVVPIESVSTKAEYAARTIRPKIRRQMTEFLKPLSPRTPRQTIDLDVEGLDLGDLDKVLAATEVAESNIPHPVGGTSAARGQLKRFIRETLADYPDRRSHPEDEEGVSGLSPYLHFGQISPVEIALAVRRADADPDAVEAFLEELVVRRELAMNYVYYTPNYDRFDAMPEWARRTLRAHADDPREPLYSARELETSSTHDRYWNAAMTEMRLTGRLHNRMRMYWGKKILEWSASPEKAFKTALRLNNRYFLDGRDANSFANVGWLFGLHDRPWPQRPIYGSVRSMSTTGLERKVDAAAYAERIEQLATEHAAPA